MNNTDRQLLRAKRRKKAAVLVAPARKPAAKKPPARKPAAKKPAARKPAATPEVPEKKPSGKRGPGKATLAAREAIGKFVDGNAHRLQKWLDQIAEGIPPELDARKKPIPRTGVPPNPEKAAQLFIQVIEYHVPKLQRTEHAGDKDNPVNIVLSKEDTDL